MTRYIIQRLVMLIPVLLGISIVAFSMLRLIPGDPATVMLGEKATIEQIEDFRERMGLNDPIHIQYLRYLQSVMRGDLGRSSVTQELVTVELGQRLPATIELTLGAMLVACTVGIVAGIIAAYYHNSFFDLATMVGTLIGVSMPIFWLGLILMYIFGFKLRWLPPSARMTVGVDLQTLNEAYHLDQVLSGPWGAKVIAFTDFLSGFYILASILTGNLKALLDSLKHLVLPSVALGSIPMAIIARMTRSSLLEVLGEDYIRTARAKGLRESGVLIRHAMKNAFLPIITVIGLQVGSLLAGAILTETIFSWPGMGRLVVNRILARDYPSVQGNVLAIALIFVFVNLIVDMSYAYLDPRIRYE
ncbi:MAG: ABC transporter permease [Anaerolineales bacterium]|nr:ABC transporter permease [Anaerolineales bacterium]